MKIVTIIGARPQFIKAATVSRAIAQRQSLVDSHSTLETSNQRSATNDQRLSSITEVILHTGQHYDANMSDIFFEQMAIPKPGYHFGIGGGDVTPIN